MAEKGYPFTARVQKSSRVGIPKWIREEFDVNDGSIVELIFVRKVKDKAITAKKKTA